MTKLEDIIDNEYLTELQTAILQQHKDEITNILSNDPERSKEQASPCQLTPLHLAAYKGDEATTEQLIQQGADINKSNRYGETPLHYAIIQQQFHLASQLIDYGAEPNKATRHIKPQTLGAAADCNGVTPELLMAQYGDSETLRHLIDKNPSSVNLKHTDQYGRNIFHYAAMNKHYAPEVMSLLNEKIPKSKSMFKPSLTATGQLKDKSPLHYAAERGNNAAVTQLLGIMQRNQSLHEKHITMRESHSNYSVLEQAAKNCNGIAIRSLLQGINVRENDSHAMYTSLLIASDFNNTSALRTLSNYFNFDTLSELTQKAENNFEAEEDEQNTGMLKSFCQSIKSFFGLNSDNNSNIDNNTAAGYAKAKATLYFILSTKNMGIYEHNNPIETLENINSLIDELSDKNKNNENDEVIAYCQNKQRLIFKELLYNALKNNNEQDAKELLQQHYQDDYKQDLTDICHSAYSDEAFYQLPSDLLEQLNKNELPESISDIIRNEKDQAEQRRRIREKEKNSNYMETESTKGFPFSWYSFQNKLTSLAEKQDRPDYPKINNIYINDDTQAVEFNPEALEKAFKQYEAVQDKEGSEQQPATPINKITYEYDEKNNKITHHFPTQDQETNERHKFNIPKDVDGIQKAVQINKQTGIKRITVGKLSKDKVDDSRLEELATTYGFDTTPNSMTLQEVAYLEAKKRRLKIIDEKDLDIAHDIKKHADEHYGGGKKGLKPSINDAPRKDSEDRKPSDELDPQRDTPSHYKNGDIHFALGESTHNGSLRYRPGSDTEEPEEPEEETEQQSGIHMSLNQKK